MNKILFIVTLLFCANLAIANTDTQTYQTLITPGETDDQIDTPQDLTKSTQWYLKAANQGNTNAQLLLGVMYHEGKNIKRDDQLSYVWLNLAALANNTKVRDVAVKLRQQLAATFTQNQINAAQQLANDYYQRINGNSSN